MFFEITVQNNKTSLKEGGMSRYRLRRGEGVVGVEIWV